jgi:hypothetical protein
MKFKRLPKIYKNLKDAQIAVHKQSMKNLRKSTITKNMVVLKSSKGGFQVAIQESMSKSQIKKMRDDFKKTGELPPHLKKLAKDLDNVKKKYKVKNVVVPGLEWMSETITEDGHTDVASAKRSMKLVTEDAQEVLQMLTMMNDEESLPSWWMNKIAVVRNDINKARDYLKNPNQ